MPTTDQPCAACHWDSARVENRGPLITTMVPPATTVSLPTATTVRRPAGQYGSAGDTCTTGPVASYSVCPRPQVRATNWPGITRGPGVRQGVSGPTVLGPDT